MNAEVYPDTAAEVAAEDRAFNEYFAQLRAVREEQRQCVVAGRAALVRIVQVMRHGTGQSYKLRALLYSLWNGKPACVGDVLCLDWSLRKDFAAVLLAFGFEEPGNEFFYATIKHALENYSLLNWFLAEGGVR